MFFLGKSNCLKFGGKVNAEQFTTQGVFPGKFESIPKISHSPGCVSNSINTSAGQKFYEHFCFHPKEYDKIRRVCSSWALPCADRFTGMKLAMALEIQVMVLDTHCQNAGWLFCAHFHCGK